MSSVFITCAVTGSGDTVGKSDLVPFTPEAIAADCIAAARAGAAIAHVHVRDPITGAPARDAAYYTEVVDRVRSSDVDVVINLTSGMGGDLTLGSVEPPLPLADVGTDMAGATERLEHVEQLRPEISTLDCGSMNFGEGDYVMTNTPATLQEMARQITAMGVRPEIEAFDTGHLWQAKSLVDEGLIDDPVMVQLCMGIPWGAPRRHQHVHGDGQQHPRRVDVQCVLHRAHAIPVRRARRDRRRQRPRRPRGQPLSRSWRARHQRRAGRTRPPRSSTV